MSNNFRKTAVLKLFDIRFSYNHCNFSRACLLVKMASKTVTRSINATALEQVVHTYRASCRSGWPRGLGK